MEGADVSQAIMTAANMSESILNLGVDSNGYFNGDNPLDYPMPLLMMQLFVTSFMAILVSRILKPLGIPEMISQIIAGILLGPSGLGRMEGFKKVLFNRHMSVNMSTYAGLGTVFQIFLVGVQVDPMMALQAGRKAVTIGVLVSVVPVVLSVFLITVLNDFVQLDAKEFSTLLMVGVIESVTAFPVIACYLTELNILNSEFSRLAFSSTMISGVLGFIMSTLAFAVYGPCMLFKQMSHMGVYVIELVVIICILKPAIGWIVKNTPAGKKVKEQYLEFVFVALLLLEYGCILANIQPQFGPFVFGMSIPSGPPIGSALVERLEFFNTWMVMPFFYTLHGMSIDIFEVDLRKHIVTILVVLAAYIGKFLGAFLPAIYHKMSYSDAISLGLTVNAQGFIEISIYSILKNKHMIDPATFDVMSVTMVLITCGFTPLLRYLHKSSTKYKQGVIRTLQHLDPNTELRVLACVYDQENVPSIIHLLKASNPTVESPINLTVINFVELVGHATPVIISHKNKKLLPSNSMSQRVINVFKHYGENDRRLVSVNPYTVVSPYTSLHNDVCMLALQKRASLVILPFHKSSATGHVDSGIRTANCNVLNKPPCSVGILIDRGLLGGVKFVFEDWEAYNVAVIFYGGADDREALAHGERMSGHPTITVTVIHIRAEGDNQDDADDTEKIEDEEMINEFRSRTSSNDRVRYIEVEIKHGFQVIKVFESVGEEYQLIVLGRRHDTGSALILELTDWNKCSELGTIGDIFVNSGCGGQATILVLQQHTLEQPEDDFYNSGILTKTKTYDC